jgi:lipid-binding SYLF domain-containing protein
MKKREFLVVGASAAAVVVLNSACTTTSGSSGDPATRRQTIDSGVDNALDRLFREVNGSKDLVAKAQGVLVFPSVVSAGFMVGGSHGNGALRRDGKTVRYYSMTAASIGLLAGARTKAVFYLFMTPDALQKFEASSGWTVGADASVTVVNVGANAAIDTRNLSAPVVGFVLTNAGLMGNLSMDGTRVAPLSL